MGSVFEKSLSMRQGDRRAYAYVLKRIKEPSAEELAACYSAGSVALGRIQLSWMNGFGERNAYYSKIITAPYIISTEKFNVRLVNAPPQLFVEEPQTIALKITNMSPSTFRLKLYIKEQETKTIAINALSHQVIKIVANL